MINFSNEKQAPEIAIWHEVIKGAEDRCQVNLPADLESYLVSLLIRFTQQADFAHQIVATAFLQAMQEKALVRRHALAAVGDQCLLVTGFFPGVAAHRQVSVRYFVDVGRSAYANISNVTTDIYGLLARQFVQLMDILQAVNQRQVLLPLEAYELWQELGSKRAYAILQGYRKI